MSNKTDILAVGIKGNLDEVRTEPCAAASPSVDLVDSDHPDFEHGSPVAAAGRNETVHGTAPYAVRPNRSVRALMSPLVAVGFVEDVAAANELTGHA